VAVVVAVETALVELLLPTVAAASARRVVVALVSAGGCSCDAAFATVIAASFAVLVELLFGLVLDGALFGLTIIVLRLLVAPAVLAALPPALAVTAAAVPAVAAAEAEGTFLAGADTFAPAPTVSVVALAVNATVGFAIAVDAAADVGGALTAARAVLRDPESFSEGTLSRAEVGADEGAEAGAEAGADPVATGTEHVERLVVLASVPAAVGGTEPGATLVLDNAAATGFVSVFAALGSVLM